VRRVRPLFVIRYWLFVLLSIFLDQVSKFLAPQVGLPVSYNRGIAFGLLAEPVLVIIAGIVLVISLARYLVGSQFPNILISQYLSLSLILGGGLSNLIDRLLLGAVRDFIKVPFWPSFNLADVSISTGAVLVIFSLMRPKEGEKESDNGKGKELF